MGRSRRNKYKEVMAYRGANGSPCSYCGRAMDIRNCRLMPTRDHITPRWMGGRETVWACWDCNRIKTDMTIEAWQQFMIDRPKWWHGVPARIRNKYRPGWVPYEMGDNGVHDDRKKNCDCPSCRAYMRKTTDQLERKNGT